MSTKEDNRRLIGSDSTNILPPFLTSTIGLALLFLLEVLLVELLGAPSPAAAADGGGGAAAAPPSPAPAPALVASAPSASSASSSSSS